jgi:eukaryotic-like serine/threonine-protein kinase
MTMRWPPLAHDDVRAGAIGQNLEPTPTPPIALGGIVAGKYRVDRVIGFGGMGIVCAASHLELGSTVAIKFIRPELGTDDRTVARFLTEARAAAQLHSQFACRVMDCGRLASGSPYIVMEYLVGQDLRSLVSTRGPLTIEEAVMLGLQACEALAEAHSKHIVHRDVKPENLFIAEGPGGAHQLKVLDFGISKQLSPLAPQRSLTDSTESIGSPSHMSPEQMIDPAGVDSRTDIWSLGVVLYEIVTGQMPFAGETGPQLCANVMTTQPLPPQAHHAEIPEGLARAILRCLEKDRERRFRDVGELGLALEPFAGMAGSLVAARVERIFGRSAAADPAVDAPDNAGSEEAAPTPSGRVASIPGVPRRGLGRRVSVGLVLLAATGLAAYAVRGVVVPVKHQESAPAPAQPSASVSAAEPAPPPPAATSARIKVKPTAPRSVARPTPPPAESAAPGIVYPELKPIPEPQPAAPDVGESVTPEAQKEPTTTAP